MLNEYFSGVDIFYEKTFQKWVLSTKKYGLGEVLLRISETLGVCDSECVYKTNTRSIFKQPLSIDGKDPF